MKLKFITPPQQSKNIKATIHRSGLMGFSLKAQNLLQLNDSNGLRIALNEEDPDDKNLYIMVESEHNDQNVKIKKSGRYYYAETKALFDEMEIDYINTLVIYDIIKSEYEGNVMFKFIRREKSRKNNQ